MNTSTTSSRLIDLLNIACGRVEGPLSLGRSMQLAIGSLLAALLLASLWGAAAGSSSLLLAVSASLKAPLIILLSTLASLPATLLALRLSGVAYPSRRLLLSICSGVLGGSLVLAALSPIVGIYYHTSAEIGSRLAVVSVFAALGSGGVIILRNALGQLAAGLRARSIAMPLGVFAVVFMAAMLQFVALASPVLPSPSAFDGGIDGILLR